MDNKGTKYPTIKNNTMIKIQTWMLKQQCKNVFTDTMGDMTPPVHSDPTTAGPGNSNTDEAQKCP